VVGADPAAVDAAERSGLLDRMIEKAMLIASLTVWTPD
jgi:hypothetical protein